MRNETARVNLFEEEVELTECVGLVEKNKAELDEEVGDRTMWIHFGGGKEVVYEA